MSVKSDATDPDSRHTRATRAVHMLLALAVFYQLGTSLIMSGPKPGQADDIFFELHEYGGIATFSIVCTFWVVLLVRRQGTDPGALFPWLMQSRRAQLRDDLKSYWHSLRERSLPSYQPNSPVASAIHGLGLLLMTAMATTGVIWFAADFYGYQKSISVELIIEVHKLLSNLAWAYLVGHAGMALLHHVRQEASLREMWSFDSTHLDP